MALVVAAGFLLDRALRGEVQQTLFPTVLKLAAVLASCMVGGLVRDRIWAGLQGRVLAHLRQVIYGRLQAVSVTFLERRQPSSLPEVLLTHLGTIETAFQSGMREGLTPALQCVVFTAVIAWADWHSAVIALLFWPWGIFAPSLVARKVAAAVKVLRQEEARLPALFQESIDARYVVRAFSLQQTLGASFRKRSAPLIRLAANAAAADAFAQRLPVAGMLVLQLVFLWLGMILLADHQLWAGQVLVLQLLSLLLSQALFRLSAWLPARQAGMRALANCEELLDDPAEGFDEPGAATLPPLEAGLAVAAEGFELQIPHGGYIALAGVSGAGKTRLLSLLMRLDIRRTALRTRFALVPQHDFFFQASVMENIRSGRTDASAEVVADVAKAIGLHPLVTALPRGYDTVLGGKDADSDWQLTRLVSLARALIRNPEVLLLDEFATPEDGPLLAWLAVGRTLILTTQRAEVARLSPHIAVLHGGKVIEQGTHEALLEAEGMYAWMARRQEGFEVTPDGLHASVEPERLRLVPALEQLPAAMLADLSAYFATEHFGAGQEIATAGEPQPKLYVIVRGSIEKSGPPPVLLHDGDSFGEESLTESYHSPATFTARTDCLCLALERCHVPNL